MRNLNELRKFLKRNPEEIKDFIVEVMVAFSAANTENATAWKAYDNLTKICMDVIGITEKDAEKLVKIAKECNEKFGYKNKNMKDSIPADDKIRYLRKEAIKILEDKKII